MKKFIAQAILKQPKQIMQYIGMWPEANQSVLYILRGLCVFTLNTVFTLLLLTKGIQDFTEGNYETGSYSLCIMLVFAHAAFKVWYLLSNKTLFFELLSNLEDPALLYHADDFDIDLQDKMEFTKKMFNTLVILCINAGISVNLCEFVMGYDKNPRLIPIETDVSHLVSYLTIWISFTIAIFYCGLIVGAFEGLVLTFLCLGIAQLKILQHEIAHAIDFYPSDINLTKEEIQRYDHKANQQLYKCVKRHNAIERYIASLEAKFALGFLVQYCITLGVTGLIGLNFIFASIKSFDFIRCIFFFMADLSQVFVIYYHCNEIILESANVRDACYMSNWKACGPSVRKTLYIMMERTKRPFYLTIGKFSIISLNTFVVILKTSMSYFTVLQRLYGTDSNLT